MAAAASALSAAGQLGDVKQGAWLQTAVKNLHSEEQPLQHSDDTNDLASASAKDYRRSLEDRIAASDAAARATAARAGAATASVAAAVPKGRPARRHGQLPSSSSLGSGVAVPSAGRASSSNNNFGSAAAAAATTSSGPLFRTREGRAFAERQQRQIGCKASASRYGGLPQGGGGSMEHRAMESGRVAEKLVEN